MGLSESDRLRSNFIFDWEQKRMKRQRKKQVSARSHASPVHHARALRMRKYPAAPLVGTTFTSLYMYVPPPTHSGTLAPVIQVMCMQWACVLFWSLAFTVLRLDAVAFGVHNGL